MKPIIILALASLALGSCTQARYYQGAVHEAAEEAKNLEAETLVAAPCLIGLGAFFRLDDVNKKKGLVLLCSDGQEMPQP